MSFLRGISCQDIVTLKSCGAGDTNNGAWGRPKNQIRVMNIGLIFKVNRWHIIFTGL